MLIALHKPFGVLSQFTADSSKHRNLSTFGLPPRVYPIGRLDAESEGLLLLTDEQELNARLLLPEHRHEREYWAQVERIPSAEALRQLQSGIAIGGRKTLPCRAWVLDPQPDLPPRVPPIRYRKNVPDCWMAMVLCEGRNHQVRRMSAAIGHPTLRLMRVRIGGFRVGALGTGEWRVLSDVERAEVFESSLQS